MITQPTLTLTAFLLARIGEDEALARAASAGPWRYNPRKEWFTDPDKLRAARAGIRQSGGEECVLAGPADNATGVAATGPTDDIQSMADAEHIARHDPARVLADCEAKRRIVEWGADQIAQWTIEREERERSLSMLAKPEHFIPGLPRLPEGLVPLRMLAQPYADHPDYREEWRP